jgi:geranylgeranyl reductase family protein
MRVVIVGAGPAGAAAAITLARGGADVVVIDKATFPRDKCCGDGLTTGALRRLEDLGLDPSTLPSWQVVDDVMVRSVSGRAFRFPLPRGRGVFAAVVRRTELDAALVHLARAAGAEVREGVGVAGIASVEGGGLRVSTDDGDVLEADYVIGADGVWSAVRKLTGATDEDGYLGEWHAFRQYRKSTAPASRDLWVLFEADLRPGYAWSFPLADDVVNVGIGILRKPGEPTKDLGRRFRDVLEREQFVEVIGDSAEESKALAWPIPARVEKTALDALDGRVLFVGDAARATDPMTGEGIGQALETGEYAAMAILSAADPAARYRRVVATGLARDNRLAGWLSRNGLAHRKGIRYSLRVAGSTNWTRRNFARWLFEDEPRAILATPHRWHRRLLNRDGAFRR